MVTIMIGVYNLWLYMCQSVTIATQMPRITAIVMRRTVLVIVTTVIHQSQVANMVTNMERPTLSCDMVTQDMIDVITGRPAGL